MNYYTGRTDFYNLGRVSGTDKSGNEGTDNSEEYSYEGLINTTYKLIE